MYFGRIVYITLGIPLGNFEETIQRLVAVLGVP